MRIGELARRTGTSQRALRYYEEQGLLVPERLPSGYRTYDESHVRVVWRIRTLLAAGLNTATIAEILPCIVDEDDVLTPGCPELVAGLHQERARMTEAIDQLAAARRMLETIIAAPSRLRRPVHADDRPVSAG